MYSSCRAVLVNVIVQNVAVFVPIGESANEDTEAVRVRFLPLLRSVVY
jgi:hypothetical protein